MYCVYVCGKNYPTPRVNLNIAQVKNVPKKMTQKPENGIEMSCKYMVKGLKYMLVIIECMVKDYLE